MDLQKFVESFTPMTCIISVEKKPGGKYGAIKIVAGNKAYIDSVETVIKNSNLPKTISNKFIPDSNYKMYIPEDLNFEDACYRCAVLKTPIHNYIHPERYDFWLNTIMLPVESDDENIAYCTYTQEFVKDLDSSLEAASISHESAGDVISTCIKLRKGEDFEATMQEVIEDIRVICDANRCCLLLMDEINRTCTILGEANAPGSSRINMSEYINDDFYTLAESWIDIIGGSYCLVLKDKDDMDYLKNRNPEWYESLIAAGAESLVIFPIKTRNEFLGYLWATNFNTENTDRIKDTLDLTSFFIASEIANYKLVNKLRTLSSIDLLTGALNRNEMNNRITELCNMDPPSNELYGMVFADMNGLKKVNDEQGHQAGDMLLRNAATILKFVFAKQEIYRAGGDEFLVLCVGMDDKQILAKIDELKKMSESFENVSFSAGLGITDDSSRLREALRLADKNMYEDKDAFYKLHPEMKAR